MLMLRAEWQWGIKLPSWHLSGKEVEEEFGFYFSSTQVQLGKASAFRTPQLHFSLYSVLLQN